ncbi:craniofacial development protein 2-like [Plakobranchus ocellatus]|uniref:Craniofacial development protein 2-like n=1 Tax=Plakobranchus ocellatus TaxID=259542 RepID=A0AAV4BJ39_9GAST|nr:craniofacial development protein 2-like [Plakobranchus ocellatus]
MVDFNAKVEDERVEDVVGTSGIGTVNERKSRLIEWCQTKPMILPSQIFGIKTILGDSGLGRAPVTEVETKQIIFSLRNYSRNAVKTSKSPREPTVIQIIFQ